MHPDNEPISLGAGTLYIIDPETGEEAPLGQVTQIRGIEVDTEEDKIVHRINNPPTATVTFHINSKRMTRKKFVKKLMADGVPRNVANTMAEIVRDHGDSYSWGYLIICLTDHLPWKET